jgi:predicted Zn-dependent protease
MPGGKVVVYTGLMPIAQNETGLAVVIAHEIAHIIARHGSERMTHGLLAELGGMGLSAALENYPYETQELFMKSYNAGAQYGVLLPYSRAHENEADHMGLIFMAMAGYDPHEAVAFWQRMAVAKQDKAAPPEFLSTHPADSTRIRKIKELIPTAMQYYQKP